MKYLERNILNNVYTASAWGIVMVTSSMLFAYIGLLIDANFNCEPTFMIGLLFLAVFLCFMRLFNDIKKNC